MTNDKPRQKAEGGRRKISRGATQRQAKRLLLLLMIVFCGSGASCNRAFRNPFATTGPPAPEVLQMGMSLDQVVAAVNQNASRIVSYQTNNASITVPGMPGIPLLRGNIAALAPGKVRLQASTTFTGPEVDLGSNDELFWFWVKRNEPPALYFSRHDQFANSAAKQVMPIEPQWLLDALGMMQFSPNDRHEGPFPHGPSSQRNGEIEIRSVIQTRGGQMSKSTIIDARRAWVLEQHVYDASGTLVASTRASKHRYYPAVGVSLPEKIELRLPAAQLSLSINVGTVQLNTLPDNPALWSLPAITPQIDLGTAAPGSLAPIRSAGSNDWTTGASPAFVGLSPQSFSNTQLGFQSSVPFTSVVPPSPTPAPVALAPVVPQGPITQRLRPGGVAIPLGVR
ncbi:MAG: hypothetical protein GXP24_13400 [Planctomycetes bacterium]|nr:hypothetical protein [Planctomycetota bacterium]